MTKSSKMNASLAKKLRRRTSAEIYFDEIPTFSDTEDEMEHNENSQFIPGTQLRPSVLSNINVSGENITSTIAVLKNVFQFSDECRCCETNKHFFLSNNSLSKLPSSRVMSSSSSSSDSGFSPASLTKKKRKLSEKDRDRKRHSRELNSSVEDNRIILGNKNTNHKVYSGGENGSYRDANEENISPDIRVQQSNEANNKKQDAFDLLLKEIETRKRNKPLNSIRKKVRRTLVITDTESEEDVYMCYVGPSSEMPSGDDQQKTSNEDKAKDNQVKGKRLKKADFKFVDKKMFKVPLDTTSNRRVQSALVRKLGRAGGGNFDEEPLTLQREGFRSFQKTTQKVRKLYSPEDWLNSKEFRRLSFGIK